MDFNKRERGAMEKLLDFHNSLTVAQKVKLSDHMDILQLLSRMPEKELIFTETFLTKIFGGCAV